MVDTAEGSIEAGLSSWTSEGSRFTHTGDRNLNLPHHGSCPCLLRHDVQREHEVTNFYKLYVPGSQEKIFLMNTDQHLNKYNIQTADSRCCKWMCPSVCVSFFGRRTTCLIISIFFFAVALFLTLTTYILNLFGFGLLSVSRKIVFQNIMRF